MVVGPSSLVCRVRGCAAVRRRERRRADAAADATRKPAPAARKPTVAPAEMTCPSPLGTGVKTKREYCDVLTGRDPKEGILIKLPPHRGPVTLRFNLHNRHTYSEEEVRMKRGFASYIAGIGVLTLDNTLLTRAAVATEFRRADDLLERISGGAGPGGVKAVAPVGVEAITLAARRRAHRGHDPRREADGGPRRRPARQLRGARPPDRHHQRRDRGVHAGAGSGAATDIVDWQIGRL